VARPELWLCRHGETDWSRSGQHTSHTDLLLTPDGVDEARELAIAIAGVTFDLVLTSPLRRASDTAELMGYPEARRDPSLAEWDYGDYEGLTTEAIRESVPGWSVWTHASPGGETPDAVGARADRVIDRVLDEATERALVVSHGHFLRVLAARWIDQPAAFGNSLMLGTATVSVLGWAREVRAITRWNVPPRAGGPAPARASATATPAPPPPAPPAPEARPAPPAAPEPPPPPPPVDGGQTGAGADAPRP
jgi:probable phosphoglycerate mutase